MEILRIGQHTASSGKQVEIRPKDLERIAAGYDPKFHEAPVVIGHPEDNQPAYGWVKGLRVLGEKLVASLDLVPEFVEAVRQGLFKKRSGSIYQSQSPRIGVVLSTGYVRRRNRTSILSQSPRIGVVLST